MPYTTPCAPGTLGVAPLFSSRQVKSGLGGASRSPLQCYSWPLLWLGGAVPHGLLKINYHPYSTENLKVPTLGNQQIDWENQGLSMYSVCSTNINEHLLCTSHVQLW